jgi:D-alanyl-lipoteichoic acid acyltransferase DltB (MBOAT superfamily)
MLFNSYSFILLFLPVTFAVFFAIGARSPLYASAWLAAASLFFYGWWNPVYVFLLLASIAFNYSVGAALARGHEGASGRASKSVLAFGISADLALLAYYKYANFFLDAAASVAGSGGLSLGEIVLPLGISFFTFTQIAFLVDTYQGKVRERNFIHYVLFVTYFPHLIAGPVLHHKEMMPQFADPSNYRPKPDRIAVGLTFFTIGLFKKAVLADGIAPYANEAFRALSDGQTLTFFEAWGGALAYSFQLYFDFSGYSDMAIGLSWLFGVRLPLNFDSPYKAVNIIDFWRRWHMTLSRFLRDYLYIALGGNRKGPVRRYANLLITMLLGGLWHGAGWTFVIWGGLHGLYLVLNHAWHGLRTQLGSPPGDDGLAGRIAGRALTFLAVVIAWVFFRADNVHDAVGMLAGMAGLHGIALPTGLASPLGPLAGALSKLGVGFDLGGGANFVLTYAWTFGLAAIAFFLPNAQQLMSRHDGTLTQGATPRDSRLGWTPTRRWALAMGVMLGAGLLTLARVTEFLYFQF